MVVAIRNCLGVDIGSHSIRVAHLEVGKAGPRVVALVEEPIRLEASAQGLTEAQRHQLLARQLQDMLKAARIRTRNAVFCIPGQSVFVKRPPKLPRTTPERLDRIIRFEARQQIPFPLDKTLMEYQVFEEGDATEVNVLLAAIKREYILNFMKMVRRTGLRPLAISVSSLALYNYHELNSSTRDLLAPPPKPEKKKAAPAKGKEKEKEKDKDKDKGKAKAAAKEKKSLFGGLLGKKKTADKPEQAEAVAEDDVPLEDMGFEEIRAYVNLGAALMDLAIPKPGAARMIGFTRSVPLAGNEMDRAIKEKLGLETLEQACAIKEKEAAVLSTEFEIDGDAESINMEASEAVTAVADRIISELRRSLDYYISQPDGVAVDAIVIAGGLARLRFLRSYIEEKMGLPVELAEPRHAQLRMPDALPDPFCPFVVATGLALQGVGMAQNTINFLPEDVKTIQSMRQRPYEMVGMAVMLAAIVGLSFNIGSNYVTQYNSEVAKYQSNIQQYTKDNEDIARATERNAKVGDAYTKLAKAVGGRRDYWLVFLQQAILEKRPPDVLIDEIQLRLDGNVIVRGKSPSRSSINTFLEELTKTPYIFKGRAEFNVPPMEARSDPRFPQPVYDFTLTARTFLRRARVRTVGENPTPVRQFPGQQQQPWMRGFAPR